MAEVLKKLRRAKKRPGLRTVMDALKLKGVEDLDSAARKFGSPITVRRAVVEDHADHASFTLVRSPTEDSWLFLIDPEGETVEVDGAEVRRAETAAPYELLVVRKPKPGVWRLVAVRMTPGPKTWLSLQAGCRNRRLHVRASAEPHVASGSAVALRASASFDDALSDLHVTARIRDPGGGVHEVALSDSTPSEPESGLYRGTFDPPGPGRYTGEVRIAGRGRGRRAGGVHRLMHGEPIPKEGASLDLGADASTFVRIVPIYFDVGPRPELKDAERSSGEVARHQPKPARKRPLKPAKLSKRARPA